MGMGLSRAGSNCFASLRHLSMKSSRIQPGSNVFVADTQVRDWDGFNVWIMIIGKFGVPSKMGMGLRRDGSNRFWSNGHLSMKSSRIQPGSNVFVADTQVRDRDRFNVWIMIIWKFGVPSRMGMGLSRAGSNCFGSPRHLSMQTSRI